MHRCTIGRRFVSKRMGLATANCGDLSRARFGPSLVILLYVWSWRFGARRSNEEKPSHQVKAESDVRFLKVSWSTEIIEHGRYWIIYAS